MTAEDKPPTGPDLAAGVAISEIPDGGMLPGHVAGEPALFARRGEEIFAIAATCTHYGGPLAEGLLVGDTVRCPWHHACFGLKDGENRRPPALNPVASWKVIREGDRVRVGEKNPPPAARVPPSSTPDSIVIIGAGPAGLVAAQTLRREGYSGPIRLFGAEKTPPVDRPNLSKDYLAGKAAEDWIPLRPPDFYEEHKLELRTGVAATAVDAKERRVSLDDGSSITFAALLLATGAEPVRLDIPGGSLPHVYSLRTLADSSAIVAAATAPTAKKVVVVGAGFIGLEAAASLRERGLEVHVVTPDARPLERVLGPEAGDFVRGLHESHGVVFHFGQKTSAITDHGVELASGESLPADLVVVGIGVRPSTSLAEKAGLRIDRGIVVDDHLETSAKGIFAAGDVARYPDFRTGQLVRIEHFVAAERQAQAAARNMLGRREPFRAVPFFWSQHYDVVLNYVGHAERWDSIDRDGTFASGSCRLTYKSGGKTLAVLTLSRDLESLEAEAAMEDEAGF